MPKTKLQDAVFTALMATLMVYGMIVYNISLDLGGVSAQSFRLALNELPLMAAIAFVLEFFVVGKLAAKLVFTVVRPTDRPQIITYAISLMIICIMCPTMSLLATLLFQQPSFFRLAPDLRPQPAHGPALAAALLRPLRPAGLSGFDAGVFPCRRQDRGL